MTSRQVYINQREARALIRYASDDPDIRHLVEKLIERVGSEALALGDERCPWTEELPLPSSSVQRASW